MFYLRITGTKNKFMGKDMFDEVAISDARTFETRLAAANRKKLYKQSLETVDRTDKRFEILDEITAYKGLDYQVKDDERIASGD